MHAPLARCVDPWLAASREARLEGTVSAARLRRLRGIATPLEPVSACLEFAPIPGAGAMQAPLRAPLPGPVPGSGAGPIGAALRIRIRARGRLRATCQRCLEPLDFEGAVDSVVLVAPSELRAAALEAQGEVVIAAPGETLEPAGLVEDELILALPFAPTHPPGTCAPGAGAGAAAPAPRAAGGDTHRPFAVLASLRERLGENTDLQE